MSAGSMRRRNRHAGPFAGPAGVHSHPLSGRRRTDRHHGHAKRPSGAPGGRRDVCDILRDLIEQVDIHPLPVQGACRLEVKGDLALLVENNKAGSVSGTGLMSVGAGTGFEPVTFRL